MKLRTWIWVLVVMACLRGAVGQVYVDANLTTGTADGSSWENAFQGAGALQAGINAAGAGEVWVAEGTYSGPNVVSAGTVLLGGFGSGDALADRDPASKVSVIDGVDAERGIVGVGVQNTVVDGFTIRNGYTAENGGGLVYINMDGTNTVRNLVIENCAAASGGGIAFTNCQAVLEDCVIDGCTSTGDGGNGRFEACNGLTVTRCTFSNGSGGGQAGGAVAGWGATTFLDCTFSGNSTSNGGGGVFYIAGNGAFDGCTFEGNSAGWVGGGLAFWDSGVWSATDCTFLDNTCDAGGGLAAWTSTIDVSGCYFSGNAGYNGSAAVLWDLQGATVQDSVFDGNLATEVVKIVNIAAGQSALVSNCLFTANDTPGCSGVRHHADAGKGPVNVVNCTFADNLGGGAPILTSGAAETTILNTIAWANNPDGGRYDYDEEGAGPATTVDYSLFERFPGTDYLDPNPLLNGVGNRSGDPLFVDAQAGDYRLLSLSPAADTGLAGDALVPDHDLLGDPRPGTTPGVSMGAYEDGVVPVDPDVDDDGLLDAWEMLYFGSLDQGADDDPDGDGMPNGEEQNRGTDPTEPDAPVQVPVSGPVAVFALTLLLALLARRRLAGERD